MNTPLCISIILLFVVLTFSKVSCHPVSNDGTSTVIYVKGDQLAGKTAKLSQFNILVFNQKNLDSSKFNNLGEVVLEAKIAKSEFVNLEVNNQLFSLFIVPGYKISISFKGEGNDLQISFSGEYAKASELLYYSSLVLRKYENLDNKFFLQLEEAEFFNRIDQIRVKYDALVDSYKKNTHLDIEVLSLIQKRNNIQLAMFEYNYVQANFDTKKLSIFQDSTLNSLRREAMQDFSLLSANSIEYGTVLNSYLQLFIISSINNRYSKSDQDLKYRLPILCDEQIMRDLYPASVRIHLRAKNFIDQISVFGLNEYIDSLYISLKDDSHFYLYRNEIADIYNRFSSLKKGQKAPPFEANTKEDKPLSMTSLIGKIVFIDVWATWCKPCLEQFPFVEKLHEEFSEDNLVFVYASIDKDITKWKDFNSIHNQPKGLHVHIDSKSLSNHFQPRYMLNGIPRYILIDSHGNIADAFAPPPSSKLLVTKIKSLLKK